jgi:uncharacterized delta-60 repeat protein
LVAAGFWSGGFALVRYTEDGDLDPTFGGSGIVTTAIGNSAGANALVLQPDGKLVAAGFANGGSGGFALVRYTEDGDLDPTFGGGEVVATNLAGGSAWATALVLQPDGKLVAAGAFDHSANLGLGPEAIDFALVRYDANGNLDPTFGTGGVVTTSITGGSDFAKALVLQPDGKLLAAGRACQPNFCQFALARFLGGTVTPTVTPTQTATPQPAATNTQASDSDGCSMTPGASADGSMLWLLIPAALVAWRRQVGKA